MNEAGAVTTARILRLSIPLMLAGAITPLLAIFDTWVIGALPGASYVAAVSVGAMLFNFCYWGFSFLRFATVGLVAQAVGAQDPGGCKTILIRHCLMAGGAALVVLVVAVPGMDLATSWLASSPEVEKLASSYILIRLWGLPCAFMNYVILGWLTALEKMRVTMLLETLRAGANAVLSVVFVRSLDGGMAGVALAPVMGDLLALVAGAMMVRRYWPVAGTWKWRQAIDRKPVMQALVISRDIMLRSLCLLTVFIAFTAGSSALGDTTLAANMLLMNLYLFFSYVMGAFSQVASTLCGQAVGSANPEQLKRAITLTCWASITVAALSSIMMVSGGQYYVAAMTADGGINATATSVLWIAASLPLLGSLSFQFDGVAIGTTQTALLRNALLVAVAAFFASNQLLPGSESNPGLWAAFIIFMCVRSVAYVIALPSLRHAADTATMVPVS